MSRTDLDALLARMDEVTAPACGACTAPLRAEGPSLYFCDDACSDRWHRTQSEPLVGYREPWHRPEDFPGVGREQFRPNPEAPETPETWGSYIAGDVAALIEQRNRTFSGWHDEIRGRQWAPAVGEMAVLVATNPDDPTTEWRTVGQVRDSSVTFTTTDEIDPAAAASLSRRVLAADFSFTLEAAPLDEATRRLFLGEWDAPAG